MMPVMPGRNFSRAKFELWHTVATVAALGVAMKVLAISLMFLYSQAAPFSLVGQTAALLVTAAGGAGLVYLLRELAVQILLFLRR